MILALLVACQVDPLAMAGIAPRLPPPPPAPAVEAPIVEEAAPAAAPPVPAGFSPISVPQGPREDGGVKWKGVSGRFDGVTQEDREMFKGENP